MKCPRCKNAMKKSYKLIDGFDFCVFSCECGIVIEEFDPAGILISDEDSEDKNDRR